MQLRQVEKGTARVRQALRTVLYHERSVANDFSARMRGNRERRRAGLPTVVEELAGECDRRFRGELAAFPPLVVRADRVARPQCIEDPSQWHSSGSFSSNPTRSRAHVATHVQAARISPA